LPLAILFDGAFDADDVLIDVGEHLIELSQHKEHHAVEADGDNSAEGDH
jgi:hypothetical protein